MRSELTNNAKMADAISAILVLESFRTDAEQALRKVGNDEKLSKYVADRIARSFSTSKERKVALNWYIKGGIFIADIYNQDLIEKVKQAIMLANRYGIDPMSVSKPDDIIKRTQKRVAEKRKITLDEIKNNQLVYEFDEVESNDGNKWHECVIDDSREGMMFVRKIVDSHYDKYRNPWCLISRQPDGSMDDAYDYWRKYCGSPKWMGFCNGRIVAFCASNPFDERNSDFIPYPDSAYVYIATQYSHEAYGRFYDEWKESGTDEEFKEWLYNHYRDDVWENISATLDGIGWIPPYDELGIEHKYEYENEMEWWDMDNEPHAYMFDCV